VRSSLSCCAGSTNRTVTAAEAQRHQPQCRESAYKYVLGYSVQVDRAQTTEASASLRLRRLEGIGAKGHVLDRPSYLTASQQRRVAPAPPSDQGDGRSGGTHQPSTDLGHRRLAARHGSARVEGWPRLGGNKAGFLPARQNAVTHPQLPSPTQHPTVVSQGVCALPDTTVQGGRHGDTERLPMVAVMVATSANSREQPRTAL